MGDVDTYYYLPRGSRPFQRREKSLQDKDVSKRHLALNPQLINTRLIGLDQFTPFLSLCRHKGQKDIF